ncbi:MAG: ATP-binding protein, partial [Planctomycetota bacterium]
MESGPSEGSDLARTTDEQRLLALQNRVLESIARGDGLSASLDLLTRLIEQSVAGALATVLLLDPVRRRLRLAAGPSIPPDLRPELDRLEPAVGMGSCGTAAATGEPAIVGDTATDERWALLRPMAERWGIRACWSLPLLSDDGEVLGTVAISFGAPRMPDRFEASLLESARHLAGIATKKDLAHREKQALEEQLRRAHKLEAIGRLAGGVAHDFSNLLTALFGHYDFLARRLVPGRLVAQTDLEELRQIHDVADRAARLVRQLLVFARQQPVELRELDPDRVLADLERMLTRVISRDVSLTLVPADPPLSIRADEGQLAQAVLDLVLNARDAMPGGGRIVISTGTERFDAQAPSPRPDIPAGTYGRISVEDTGVGIEADDLDRIFEPFFTTKAASKGTGLGLAGVHGFVQASRGFVHVESSPGRGTRFDLLFPLATAAQQRSEDTDPGAGPAWRGRGESPVATVPGARLLLCEDDHHVRQFVERLLRRSGYEVQSAADAEEAERLFDRAEGAVDLLLTDLVLPGRDGRELVESLR